ncbi:MAG: hypothetical protein JO222_03840 [Frankiales bacterium]|nr:hypothetical protein [Frankiales bacterium]
MGSKDKGRREVKKPKKDKKSAPAAAAPRPIIPPTQHSSDHGAGGQPAG